jgi:hypothetical protein
VTGLQIADGRTRDSGRWSVSIAATRLTSWKEIWLTPPREDDSKAMIVIKIDETLTERPFG